MKIFITTLLFVSSINLFSQANFQGIATYESKTDVKSMGISFPGMDEGQQEIIKARMAKAFEKTFELKFTATESVYTEPQKLDKLQDANFKVSGGDINIYKNLKDKVALSEEDIFDKAFLVSEKLQDFKWETSAETKLIGAYSCQKAVSTVPVSEEEMAEYEADLKKQEANATNLLGLQAPKPKITTVWFTLDIPISNGPSEYCGLPGLILEANDGRTILLCSKIVLNPTEKFEIKKPKKGKPVTREIFNKIQEEKMESMKNKDGVMEIRIGQ